MPPGAKQEYSAFISYSHEDDAWAQRLYQDLIDKKGIPKERLFLDKPTMEVGDLWREQLRAALNSSCYLVVLWSSHSTKSEWVDHELAFFENKISLPGADLIKVHQRMIFVSLDSDSRVFTDIQMIRDLKEANAYNAASPKDISFVQNHEDVWDDVVEAVYNAITKDDVSIPIPRLIMATTSDRLTNNVKFDQAPEFGNFTDSLDELISNIIKVESRDDLIARYGPNRADWKPIIGNESSISRLLDLLRDQINTLPNSPTVRWVPVSDDFWNDQDSASRIAQRLAHGLSLIVIDPLSLYDPRVHARFNDLKDNGCFDNQNGVVLVLSPFSMREESISFRNLIKQVATLVFNDFYQPGVRRFPNARCSVNFGDELGMARPVLATIRQYLQPNASQQTAIQTSVGGSQR